MAKDPDSGGNPSPTAREALHLTLAAPFGDVVPYVQLEHEFVGYETVRVTRLDEMIEGMLKDRVSRTALLVMCHPELAREALAIDYRLAGLLPCTTAIYEAPDEHEVHVHHVSTMKAMRDLGCTPSGSEGPVARMIERSGELMGDVWSNIRDHANVIT